MLAFVVMAGMQAIRRQAKGSALVVAAVITAAIAGITEEWWLDPATAAYVAAAFGLLFGLAAGGRLVRPGPTPPEASPQ